jgi:hypothetical protein
MSSSDLIETFISRWENSGAAERANYQMFLSELCDLLDVPRPNPTSPDPEKNLYVFDRAITRVNPDGSSVTNYIDLYHARHFVCETKQGSSEDSTQSKFQNQQLVRRSLGEVGSSIGSPATKIGHGKRGSSAFDKALERAYHQGRDYITHLPASHGRPPFLIVCDVGHSIDLYAEFTCTGGRYERFPDPKHHRILLADLRQEEIRERLRLVFTDPHALDPSKRAAEVTRDIANRLAHLSRSLEKDGHHPEIIAGFLQRCLFTMFAEDIGLLPDDGFKNLIAKTLENPQGFPVLVSGLWKEMATGTSYSSLLFQEIAYFNGGLFDTTTALPLQMEQIHMLHEAAMTDWSGVEPSIFGTLLTRALDARERHKLGAEYTPRSYVERLIRPTIIDPLREQWESTRLAAATLHNEAEILLDSADVTEDSAKQSLASGNATAAKEQGAAAQKLRADAKKKDAEALKLVTAFHRHLCALKILDPACGTANFLYVTLEHMKRLEAEVLELVTALGGDATFEMNEYKVRPEQFLGLELSPNAVAIAQLVLWIGYFQWQRKTTGKADTGDRPLLPKTQSIRQQDAVLAYDDRVPRTDPDTGKILTIWDGHTTKPHPVTGKEVPDETATIALFDYINPRRAEWPQADYIVGNPPFIGASRMRDALGDGYTEALRKAWKGIVPESADFVMFWWAKAAEETAQKRCKRFGFITTNSIHQTFNRRVIESYVGEASRLPSSLHLAYAIPDHPWIDSADAAAVRIAMTVAAPGNAEGILETITNERPMENGECEVAITRNAGKIAANLQLGADLTSVIALQSNSGISSRGHELGSSGFILSPSETKILKSFSRPESEQIIRPYLNGRDLTDRSRGLMLIDAHGLDENELRERHPGIYQHLLNRVKPERSTNRDLRLRNYWWLHRRSREDWRQMAKDLPRFIATVETSKHRFFTFLAQNILPDNKLIVIAADDSFYFGVLSSIVHVNWTLAQGSQLGPTPVYVKTTCFESFPFPALEEGELKQRIRDLGERLDAHRKRQQELHPTLTLTGMYNVLEKLRAGEPLNAKEKTIHDQGLVTILQQLHDDLDAAVLEAYGWADLNRTAGVSPASSPTSGRDARAPFEQELLTRLVALNHERAAEEKRGQIRYLRPDYQNPTAAPTATQSTLAIPEASPKSKIKIPQSSIVNQPTEWPEKLPDQVQLIRHLLQQTPTATAAELSDHFARKNQKRTAQIEAIIETLKSLGQV